MGLRTVADSRPLLKNFGYCLNFPGNAGSISLGNTNPFTGAFYFSAWIKWFGLNGGFQTLLAKRDSYAANGMMFSMALDSTLGTLAIDTVTSFVPFGYIFPQGKWTHMTWVHDVSAFQDRLYINGLPKSTQGIATLGTKTDALIMFGANQATSQDWLNGRADEIVIGTGLPTDDQVYALYAKFLLPGVPWTYLKLDENTGSQALDATANGHNGAIAGATYIIDPVRKTRLPVTGRQHVSRVTI